MFKHKHPSTTYKSKGFAMVEVIISLAIAVILMLAFQTLLWRTARMADFSKNSFLATMYLREAIEITRDLEVSDWGIFPTTCPSTGSQTFHPIDTGGAWSLAADEELLDGGKYTRSIVIESVFRNQLAFPNHIVSSGGSCDDNTKKAKAVIAWNDSSGLHTMDLEAYIYNF